MHSGASYSVCSLNMCMSVSIYILEREDWPYLETVWAYCQSHCIYMYRTRVDSYTIRWVVELDMDSKSTTMFLLMFGESVTSAMGRYYV